MRIPKNKIRGSVNDSHLQPTQVGQVLSDGCVSGHEWVVFSTALKDVSLLVQCVNCGAGGTVDDPTKEEWSEAFHAPTSPYGWDNGSRVVIRGRGPLYITKVFEGQDESASSHPVEGTGA